LKLILKCGFELYKKAAHWTVVSQKVRGNMAEFKILLTQLFIAWFDGSARPFCWEESGRECIELIPWWFKKKKKKKKKRGNLLYIYIYTVPLSDFKNFNRNIIKVGSSFLKIQ